MTEQKQELIPTALTTPIHQGYSITEAVTEAKRCLQCKNPSCKKGCPISHDIPQWIHAISVGNIGDAARLIYEKSNLPAMCGRVCPHEKQCEGNCILNKKEAPIRVGKLERFVAEFAQQALLDIPTPPSEKKGRVAVVGAGPAGLTAAEELALRGYEVVLYEEQELLGGILTYGIPEFRLPKKSVMHELERIHALNIDFRPLQKMGRDFTIDSLRSEGYDAIFLGIGATATKRMNFPGDDLEGVVQSAHFLHQANLLAMGKISLEEVPVKAGQHVIVIGGGNVAMDGARTALRMGAKVTVMYRRTNVEMPALKSEYEQAVQEGVTFHWRTQVRAAQGENGKLKSCTAVSEAGEAQVDVDVILVAIGSEADKEAVQSTQVATNEWGYIQTKEMPYGITNYEDVFAAGDIVHSPETVVLAMREAKKVAQDIDRYITAKKLITVASAPIAND